MKLIDKAAVVAEIERIRNQEIQWENRQGYTEYHQGLRDGYTNILSFLDTIESKEVDLEKEIKDYFNSQPIITRTKGVDYQIVPSGEVIAKHFFELGIQSQLSWQDIRKIAEIGEDFMNSEESDNLSEEKYYTAILNKLKETDYKTSRQEIRDLVQKGE